MCGICGSIARNGNETSVRPATAMMKALESRGPDAKGLFVQGNAALGHRRLKIIDLSEKSHQPMVDNALGLAVVFNGAIYNYRELRDELGRLGHEFFSNGDTEVILKAYHVWGEKCVEHFNGMFAFAVWERDTGRLFLARDRLGIKPLYFCETASEFRFASSLPALLKGGGIDKEINPIALNYYMTFHSVVPAPMTIIRGVSKLPPATTMTVEPNGRRKTEVYWNLDFGPKSEERSHGFEEWRQKLVWELDKSVNRRLTADVPVGVLLSGGLDSSLVVGMLALNGQKDLKTFSIGFESVNDEEGNEFRYSDIIAEHFSTDHHRIEVDSERALPAIEECVLAMSEPMVSHDCIGFYLLSQEVAKHVKVVQSGQGADEIFAGYHWYPPLMESADPVGDYARVFFDRDHKEYLDTVHPRFHGENHGREFVLRNFSIPGADTPIDKALRLDSTVMLVDDPVKRVDNMTMAWGLEARVPFLDHNLVEFAARIPPEFKVKDGGKHVLKEAAREILPNAVIDRPKGYFPVPALKYLQGEYLEFVREILYAPTVRRRELFNPAYVDRLMEAPESHITPLNGSKLWQIALLEYWLTLHDIG